ncbi:MAG: pitrilysin family protein [Candidatus Binataceae bacterium]
MAVTAAFAIVAGAAAPSHAIEIKRMTLKSGATLLVSEQHQLPMVTMAIAFDAGSRRDPKGKEGRAALTAESLMQGTRELSADQFNQAVDFIGSSVSVSAGQDYAEAGLTTLKKYTDDTLHLLAGVLETPGLRDSDIERKRDEQVAGIKAAEEQPGYVAGVAFRKALFGDSPYGHSPEGNAESVAGLTPADVRDFYHEYYKLGGAVIAVVGDVKADEIRDKLEASLSGLAGSVPPQAKPPAPTVPAGIHLTTIDRNVAQANLILGFGGIARSDPDYYRLQVMNYILGGGGFASRLTKEVRSKAGLAYSIGSMFNAALFPGSFEVVLQTKNKSANEALRMILDQMREIQNAPVSDAELASARKFLVGSFPLKIDRQSAIASFMLQIELYGLGLDYADRYPKLIEAVTKEDVQRVAKQYLHPDALLLVAAANQSEAAISVANLEKR